MLSAPHEAADKAARVRQMFNSIAPRYELINGLFSAGLDNAWRRQAVKLSGVGPEDDVLDVACGTGDFARAFAAASARSVLGCDFAHAMLTRAASRSPKMLRWCEADAQRLPFPDGAFSIVSCAFGIRNFHNLDQGLAEMHRVLRPRGRLVILEFSRPGNRVIRAIYELYTGRLMPVGAALLSGDRSGAYRYLPSSVVSFLDAGQMDDRLRRAGFVNRTATPLTLGTVTVYVGTRN